MKFYDLPKIKSEPEYVEQQEELVDSDNSDSDPYSSDEDISEDDDSTSLGELYLRLLRCEEQEDSGEDDAQPPDDEFGNVGNSYADYTVDANSEGDSYRGGGGVGGGAVGGGVAGTYVHPPDLPACLPSPLYQNLIHNPVELMTDYNCTCHQNFDEIEFAYHSYLDAAAEVDVERLAANAARSDS